MAKFKLLKDGVKREDGANIPNDPRNRDWQEYQDWIALGNTADPEDQPPVEDPDDKKVKNVSAEKLMKSLVKALKKKGVDINFKDIVDEI